MLVAVDLDDVLGDYIGGLISYCNREFDMNLAYEDFTTYDVSIPTGLPRSEAVNYLQSYESSPGFVSMEVIDGAPEGVRKIGVNNRLISLTSRPLHHKSVTEHWSAVNFPTDFEGIYFSRNDEVGAYDLGKDHNNKAKFCIQHGVDVLIEDNLEYALAFVGTEMYVLLIDRPWNQAESLPENVIRTGSWGDRSSAWREVPEKLELLRTDI